MELGGYLSNPDRGSRDDVLVELGGHLSNPNFQERLKQLLDGMP
jgi:hypothetical protein